MLLRSRSALLHILLVLGLHAVLTGSRRTYDYIVVGSGPGGATVARWVVVVVVVAIC